MENIENIVDKVVKAFEEKPVSSTLKGIILLWILKEVMKWFKK